MLRIEHLSKAYPNDSGSLEILRDFSFDIASGELITIFGPNGSGKTTLFNIIAGAENLSAGHLEFNGQSIKKTAVGFVFQNYNDSMFPWLTLLDNVIFPLTVRGVPKKIATGIAKRILSKANLWEHRNSYIYQLSGGIKQLTAIARAFIGKPDLLLMDEPCSALDFATTKKIELELLNLWEEYRPTTLVISHDVDEAVFLADKVIVLSPRPAEIKAVIPITLPRPRSLDMLTSQSFIKARTMVLEAFSYE